MAANTDKLVELFNTLAGELALRITSEDATAADLAVARQFLKDNGITCDLAALRLSEVPSGAKDLSDALPFVAPEHRREA